MTRRWLGVLIVAFGLMAIMMGIAAVATRDTPRSTRASTFNPGPPGLRALYEALRAADVPVRRWHRPYVQLPPEAGVLVMAAPVVPIAAPEWQQHILPWVTGGRTLILASGLGDPLPLRPRMESILRREVHYGLSPDAPDANADGEDDESDGTPALARDEARVKDLVEQLSRAELEKEKRVHVSAVQNTALTPEAAPLDVSTFAPVYVYDPHAVPLYAADGTPYAWYIPMHEGQIILTATPAWLSNRDVARGQNLELLLRVLNGLGGGRPVLFDERVQGYATGDVRFRDLWTHPAWATAFAQLLVFGVWYAASQGRRFGRAVPLDRSTPRSTLEYVDAMANLYRRAGLHRPALAAQWRSFRVGVARRYGIEARTSPNELRDRLVSAVPDLDPAVLDAALTAVRETVRTRRALSERDLVRASRTLDRLQKEVL